MSLGMLLTVLKTTTQNVKKAAAVYVRWTIK